MTYGKKVQLFCFYFGLAWLALGGVGYFASMQAGGHYADMVASIFGQKIYSIHQQRTVGVAAMLVGALSVCSELSLEATKISVAANVFMLVHFFAETFLYHALPPFTFLAALAVAVVPFFMALFEIDFRCHCESRKAQPPASKKKN